MPTNFVDGMIEFLREELSTVKGALRALFVVGWLGLMLFTPSEKVVPAWMSPQARESLALGLKEFCAELYPESTCPNINEGGKSRYFVTALFSAGAAPSIDSVAAVLQRKGWVLGAQVDVHTTTYCRAGYAASYITSEERVWVQFSSGNPMCEQEGPPVSR